MPNGEGRSSLALLSTEGGAVKVETQAVEAVEAVEAEAEITAESVRRGDSILWLWECEMNPHCSSPELERKSKSKGVYKDSQIWSSFVFKS